jgi:hypothetical protein
LAAAIIACFLLLSKALIGVAVTGERKWLRELVGDGTG